MKKNSILTDKQCREFILSIANKKSEATRRIINEIDDPDAIYLDSRTILMIAAESCFPLAVELLLDRGADINAVDSEGMTPLFYAFIPDHNAEIIELLIARGADVHHRDICGDTLLTQFARDQSVAHLPIAIKNGADINAANHDGDTPLTNAATWGHLKAVTFLIESGADINLTDGEGYTAEQLAAAQNHHEIVRYLRSCH